MKRTDRKDFGKDYYIGLPDLRALFRMPKLEQALLFGLWTINEFEKIPTERQRKQVAGSTFAALKGDYEAVFLDKMQRGIKGNQLSYKCISEPIPSCRYGKATEKSFLRMAEVFVDQEDIFRYNKFVEARTTHRYHQGCKKSKSFCRHTFDANKFLRLFRRAMRFFTM